MAEPVDLLSAASDGFFALLDAAIGADVAEVTTETPQLDPGDPSERQFVLIGDIDAGPAGSKGDDLKLISVQIVVIYRGTQRSKLHALMHKVAAALTGAVPAIAGIGFHAIEFAGSASGPPARDGVTYAGLLEFEVYAEPA